MTRTIVRCVAFIGACVLTAGTTPRLSVDRVLTPSVTTLLFHQVTDHPITSAGGEDTVKQPWTTPAAFDALLTQAERDGYHVIPAAAAVEYLTGTASAHGLPAKPLVLTFDDGYASAYTDATPIMQKHHAVATMFFEGQLTDVKAGRLTTAQLRAMRDSGAWDLESHGWIGHGNIVIDRNGTLSPYWYANLAWLGAQNRFETRDEFKARIQTDLRRFRSTFEPQLGIKIRYFAYPSGEFGQNAALAPGGDRQTRLEAGHSNANDLQPLLDAALESEGYTAAFAVSIPGVGIAATRADRRFALPRLGVGATFDFAAVAQLNVNGTHLPEISSRDRFLDPGPLAIEGSRLFLASHEEPELYELNLNGHPRRSWRLPELLDDRLDRPSLVSALKVRGDTIDVVQQAGWWPNATPRITRLRLEGDRLVVVSRRALPSALSWVVGVTDAPDGSIAMTDEGALFNIETGQAVGRIAVTDDLPRHNRFAGPAHVGSRLIVFDRIAKSFLLTDTHGHVEATAANADDIRNLAAAPGEIFVVNWHGAHHLLERFSVNAS